MLFRSTFDGPGSVTRTWHTIHEGVVSVSVTIVWTPVGRPGPNFVRKSTSRVTVEAPFCAPPQGEIQTRERTEVDCAATFRRVLTEVREQTFKQDKTGAWVAAGWLPWEITDTRAEPLEPGDCESIDFPVWTVEHCWGTQTWTNRGNGDRLVETVPKRDANCAPDETSVEEGF